MVKVWSPARREGKESGMSGKGGGGLKIEDSAAKLLGERCKREGRHRTPCGETGAGKEKGGRASELAREREVDPG